MRTPSHSRRAARGRVRFRYDDSAAEAVPRLADGPLGAAARTLPRDVACRPDEGDARPADSKLSGIGNSGSGSRAGWPAPTAGFPR